MRILIACEFSGTVRDAFRARGHDAVSCDLLPSERPGPHIEDNVLAFLGDGWDMMIACPPCTHLAVSGARWFRSKAHEQAEALRFVRALLSAPIPRIALRFVRALLSAPIPRIALENPVSIISSQIRRPDQIIQPWQFGHPQTKTTCLWLKNLPRLHPTKVVERGPRHVTKSGRSLPGWYNLPPGPDRASIRSRTFAGIAAAMAEQWGRL